MRNFCPKEYKLIAMRDCPLPDHMRLCDTPERAVDYWRLHIVNHPAFNPDVECFAVLLLNTRRRVIGHHLVSVGTLDSILVHPREGYRVAITAAASVILCLHNHPSGQADPSQADINVTRDLVRAGQILKIELMDHIIVGNAQHVSLREHGYFY